MGQTRERWSVPCRLQFQRVLVSLYAVSLARFIGIFSELIISPSLLGERKYSHAIPPVSMVLAEVCWVTFMTMMTFLSGVLSTRLDPAKMCSLITGRLRDADAVRNFTN